MPNIIVKGGPVMVPIILLSVVALAIIVERIGVLRRIRLDLPAFAERVFRLLRHGDLQGALEVCERVRHPVGRVFAEGIRHRELPREALEQRLERVGEQEVHALERNLPGLIVIVGIEPMLGFLGTITGLIRAFMNWERLGADITVSALAGGIYEAMITTAAGLIAAIPYYLAYHLIVGKIQDHARGTSLWGDRLLDVLSAAGEDARQ
jgi:biopolymer transport protein ExbB